MYYIFNLHYIYLLNTYIYLCRIYYKNKNVIENSRNKAVFIPLNSPSLELLSISLLFANFLRFSKEPIPGLR